MLNVGYVPRRPLLLWCRNSYVIFVACRATGLYIFAYSIFYWFFRSNMSGSLQTANYFGYTLLLCYVVSMMLSTIGFFASLKFVKYIYSNVKTD